MVCVQRDLPREIAVLPGEEPLVIDPVKELLQVKIDDPPVPCFQVALGLCDGRVTAPPRSEGTSRSSDSSRPIVISFFRPR